ncbi:MAG: hypothetical protein SVV80_10435 [Planctomycetota bacterium]|nr:hypothetical protein [Planctomycetota bacterium]
MNTHNEDYEIIARRMDGEDIDLTEAQKALAEEIAADAEVVGRALDVRLPGGTLHRVNARIGQSHVTERKRRTIWLGRAAAVAAAVIVAAVLLLPSGPDEEGIKITEPLPTANGELFVLNIIADDDLDFRVEALSEDLDDTRTAMMLDEDFSTEMVMASFEQEMEELMLEENGLDSWPDQQ